MPKIGTKLAPAVCEAFTVPGWGWGVKTEIAQGWLEAAPPVVPDIVQRDDGMFAIGWHDDAPGPFESRQFALAVAACEMQRSMVARS